MLLRTRGLGTAGAPRAEDGDVRAGSATCFGKLDTLPRYGLTSRLSLQFLQANRIGNVANGGQSAKTSRMSRDQRLTFAAALGNGVIIFEK